MRHAGSLLHCEGLLLNHSDSLAMPIGLVVLGSVVATCRLSCPKACGILVPQTRDQTHGPCIAKQILNHLTSREVPVLLNTFCLILWLLYCLSFAFYLTRSSLREVIIVFIFVFLPQNLLLLEHVSFIWCVRLYKLGINSTANKVKHTTMA